MSKRKPRALAHRWREQTEKRWGELISSARPSNPIGTYARDGGKYYAACYDPRSSSGKELRSGPLDTPAKARQWVERASHARIWSGAGLNEGLSKGVKTVSKRKVKRPAAFPKTIRFRGKVYHATGKKGVVVKTGLRAAEYQYVTSRVDRRCWLDERGNKKSDD